MKRKATERKQAIYRNREARAVDAVAKARIKVEKATRALQRIRDMDAERHRALEKIRQKRAMQVVLMATTTRPQILGNIADVVTGLAESLREGLSPDPAAKFDRVQAARWLACYDAIVGASTCK